MLTRRTLATLTLAAPFVARARERAPEPVQTLILMGDLHSGYAWTPKLLAAVRREVALAQGQVAIVVNGDVFEHNNAIARRNDGAVDLALLRGFVGLAPTYVTIGNHDSDLFDPRRFVEAVQASGAVLLTDIVDPRSHLAYGPPSVTLRAGRLRLVMAALGTPVMAVYPKAWRDAYAVPDPAAYAKARFGSLFAGADLSIALVHAGFMADRSVLPALKAPFLLHGAHDHLRFAERLGADGMHLQSGAWSSAFQVVRVFDTAGGIRLDARDVVLGAHSAEDRGLAAMLSDAQALLTPADLAVVGHAPQALGLDAAVLFLADSIRRQDGVDLVLLQHTTFGDGLPAGPVRGVERDAFLRFDGPIAYGRIDGAALRDVVLRRVNQFDGRTPYARRTGDFLYATPLAPDPARTYSVAISAYSVSSERNRRELLGADLPGFVADPKRSLSAAIATALTPA